MTRFSLVFEHFDIAFSDDAQVLHLHQRLFSAFGIELLQVAFSVLERRKLLEKKLSMMEAG